VKRKFGDIVLEFLNISSPFDGGKHALSLAEGIKIGVILISTREFHSCSILVCRGEKSLESTKKMMSPRRSNASEKRAA
jgi:hypothetical protein